LQPSVTASDKFVREAALPEDVVEQQNRVSAIFQSVRDAVAQRDFDKAHQYSNEERIERDKLRSLYQRYGLLDWLYEQDHRHLTKNRLYTQNPSMSAVAVYVNHPTTAGNKEAHGLNLSIATAPRSYYSDSTSAKTPIQQRGFESNYAIK